MFKKPFVSSVLTNASFTQKLNRKRGAAAGLPLAFLVSLLLVAPVSVNGQSCEQGGSPLCGPNCSSYSYNILWDPDFLQTNCSAWEFDSGTERALTGSMCGGWSPPFGRFNGPSFSQWVRIQQQTPALWDPQWPYFKFSYTYEINDPMNNPYTQLEITIRLGGVRYSVDAPPSGSQWCNTRHINLGYHPEWVGQLLWVEIWAYQPGYSTISVTNTGLWQSRYNN